MRKHKQGLSLSVKIYLLIIVIIVTVSAALVFTGYNTFCQNVDEAYHNRTINAVSAGSEFVNVDFLDHFWQAIQTEDFLRTRQKAADADDEEMLIRWMKKQPGLHAGIFTEDELAKDPGLAQYTTLYDEYNALKDLCVRIRDTFDVADSYIQKDVNGVTYNVIDPNESVFIIGTPEAPIK
ncbi:MAG: hypothetical protein IIY60_10340, partial [Clostridia bacterium]|nr:hypothetical protein [Clostridia bacterium]